jgi:hypothetical protein
MGTLGERALACTSLDLTPFATRSFVESSAAHCLEAATLDRSCGPIEGSLDLINEIVLATLYDPHARPSATRVWISGILGGAAGHGLHQLVVLLRRR